MQPVPGPGAVHRTWISVFGTEEVWVIPLGQTSLKRLNESLKSRKLPAVSGDVGTDGFEGLAVSKKPTNRCRMFWERHPCSVTVNRKSGFICLSYQEVKDMISISSPGFLFFLHIDLPITKQKDGFFFYPSSRSLALMKAWLAYMRKS